MHRAHGASARGRRPPLARVRRVRLAPRQAGHARGHGSRRCQAPPQAVLGAPHVRGGSPAPSVAPGLRRFEASSSRSGRPRGIARAGVHANGVAGAASALPRREARGTRHEARGTRHEARGTRSDRDRSYRSDEAVREASGRRCGRPRFVGRCLRDAARRAAVQRCGTRLGQAPRCALRAFPLNATRGLRLARRHHSDAIGPGRP